jgi:L-ascorbate metabolism protein UlaG (beta-lactamase superfamily)
MTDPQYETDVIQTSAGELEMTFLGHGSLMFTLGEKIIHIDPFGRVADYSKLPKADLVLITHEHHDHLDTEALAQIRTDDTEVVMTKLCESQVEGGIVMRNGDVSVVQGLTIEAVPAYNLIHTRETGDPFHPCGHGNGYILTVGDTRVYIAGDSENTPEMMNLRDIDVAFLPMNLPYTMTPEMVAEAARAIGPGIVYPYHYGNTDTSELVDLLKDRPDIEVRIRRLA